MIEDICTHLLIFQIVAGMSGTSLDSYSSKPTLSRSSSGKTINYINIIKFDEC